MSLACLRVYARHRLALGAQEYVTPTSASRSRERKNEGPVLQYVGKLRKPNHKVFVCGFSYTGALGIPSFVVPDSGRKKPRKYQLTSYCLETEQQISSAACGYVFTLLSFSTKVWGMILNRDSQLGFQRTQQGCRNSHSLSHSPHPPWQALSPPTSLFKGTIWDLAVVCGQDHSLFLTETGKVYACGWGADGQTGLLSVSASSNYAATVCVGGLGSVCYIWSSSPVLSGVLCEFKYAPSISLFLSHSRAGSVDPDRGELFIWGKNVRGCLGIAKKLDQYFSWRVTLPGHVIDVACGVDHMVALVKSVI
ncbi:RCC1-like G exchanging factor-like protein [Salvelinus alpinus]